MEAKTIWYTLNFGKVYYDNKAIAYVTKNENGNYIYK